MKTDDLSRGVHRRFEDIIPGIRVRADQLFWPADFEPGRSGRYLGNNLYRDLTGRTWSRAESVLQAEEALLRQAEELCGRRGGAPGEAEAMVARTRSFEYLHHGLDLGTIAAVHAISAAGGIPISSCNGGSFGGAHSEEFPVISFCWRRAKWPILRECAKQAGVSAWLHHRGEVVIGADYIRRFLVFAQAVLERRARIEALDERLSVPAAVEASAQPLRGCLR